jgi:hypothetical protein
MSATTLSALATSIKSVPDPRSKQGVSHPFTGLLALVLIGLTARQIYMSHIVEWAQHHWQELKTPLGFESEKPPSATTISRSLAKLSLKDFQQALTHFFRFLLAEHRNLTAAVDGKTSKQFRLADGGALHMLNLFIHDFNLVLAQYSVKGDKTNEGNCLKQHAEDFFKKYPFVQLLTGDAAFTNRPLLQVLQDLGKDYLFCVKNNQPTLLESMVQTFADVDWDNLEPQKIEKKRLRDRPQNCGEHGGCRVCLQGVEHAELPVVDL